MKALLQALNHPLLFLYIFLQEEKALLGMICQHIINQETYETDLRGYRNLDPGAIKINDSQRSHTRHVNSTPENRINETNSLLKRSQISLT